MFLLKTIYARGRGLVLSMVASSLLLSVVQPAQAAPAGKDHSLEVEAKAAQPARNLKLEPGMQRISFYGERPAWSPDGKKVLYVGKSFGDIFEVDLATRATRNLTGGFQHEGFIRAQYLPNGDYLLTGPRKFKDQRTSRMREAELWVMDKSGARAPMPLDVIVHEGVAVAQKTMRIAWTKTSPNWTIGIYRGTEYYYPKFNPDEYSTIYVGEITYNTDGTPQLVNRREIIKTPRDECWTETQDFRDNDQEVIYSCLRMFDWPGGTMDWATRGVRIDTKKVVDYRYAKNTGWEEVEGISPDGSWTTVECGPPGQPDKGRNIVDICILRLDRKNTELKPVTHFADQGGNANNSVVSPDGKWIAFAEVPNRNVEVGTASGIIIMKLP